MESERNQPSKVHLFAVVVLANMSSFLMGTAIAWCSPIIPKFKYDYEDNPIDEPLTPDMQGWVFSSLSIGALCSVFLVGPLADIIGRRQTIILSSCIYGFAYIVMMMANNIKIVYTGRLIMGMGAGLSMTVIPMYMGEISTKEIRGSAGSIIMLFMTLGMLFIYCIGPFTRYVVLQICGFTVALCSIGGYMYIPESPLHLVRNDRVNDAIKALQKLRGQDAETVRKEIPDILEIVDESRNMSQGACKDIIANPGYRRAFIIAVGLMFFQMFSGALVIVVNSQTIFIQANSAVEPAFSSIIVGCVQVCSSMILQAVVDKLKRRTLLRISATGMCVAQLSIGTYFYIQLTGDVSKIRWIPISAFIIFQVCYRIGFGPLPFAILGELFTPNIKAIAGTSVTFTCWGLGFVIGRFYPPMDQYGSHFVFWFFGICNIMAFLFAQFVVIETKGLTLAEIQERLQQIK